MQTASGLHADPGAESDAGRVGDKIPERRRPVWDHCLCPFHEDSPEYQEKCASEHQTLFFEKKRREESQSCVRDQV